MTATYWAAAVLPFAAALYFLIRLYPIWPRRHEGCDAYNILLCAETLCEQKRLPIRLPPVFILEEQDQWYPPGFLVLCALLPQAWIKRYYWLLNHLIDFANIMLGFSVVAVAGFPFFAASTIAVYAAMAGLVQEYAALNTRPFGVLLVSAFLLATFAAMVDPVVLPLAAAIGVLLLYSHKLAIQFLWFAIPSVALAAADWRWLASLPAIYLLAFIFWPSGFRNIEAGHVAIVRFWGRYWPLLGAHAVRQSYSYGDGKTRTNFYRKSETANLIALAKDALHQNYFIVPALWLGATSSLDPWMRLLLGWIAAAYVAAFAIHVIRPLRAIGMGRQYVKFAILPTLVLIAQQLALTGSGLGWVLALAALALTARQYWLVARAMRAPGSAQTAHLSADLQTMLDRIAALGGVRLMCLPVHLCDLVAYLARVPVYWGTHSHVFDEKLAEFFPVLRRPISHYVRTDGLTHLLIDNAYVSAAELALDPATLVVKQGPYELFGLRGAP